MAAVRSRSNWQVGGATLPLLVLVVSLLPVPVPGAAAGEAPPVPAYVRRGDETEAHYRGYRDRLERFHESLDTHVKARAPDLQPKLASSKPKPVAYGYQVLPKLVADSLPPAEPARAKSRWYSWPWTDQLIERETQKLESLEAELGGVGSLSPERGRTVLEKLVAETSQLTKAQRMIDAHVKYNRFWQPVIAHDRAGFDRATALHDAVLERQAVRDALGAADDTAFLGAAMRIRGIDTTKGRDAVRADLEARKAQLTRRVQDVTGQVRPPSYLRVEHPEAHRWIIRVPVNTDIDDRALVDAFRAAVESWWRVRDRGDEFSVQLSITYLAPARLYGARAECRREPATGCSPPAPGDKIDLHRHIALFPKDGAILTTGAVSLHAGEGAIVLGPHEVTPRVLAHEFGHVLGFGDSYFRGYRDLASDGLMVMEVLAEPDDIMSVSATGVVHRFHFEKIIANAPAQSPQSSSGEEVFGTDSFR